MASLNRMRPPAYSSAWGCLQDLLRTEGMRGLTRGVGGTMARETPGNAIFFMVYEVSSISRRPCSSPCEMIAPLVGLWMLSLLHKFITCCHLEGL